MEGTPTSESEDKFWSCQWWHEFGRDILASLSSFMKWRIKGALIVWTKLVNSNIPHICNLIITICRTPEFDFWVRKIPCGREWQPTPVFLLENLHGQRNLVGYSLWGRKESDTTERLHSLSLYDLLFLLYLFIRFFIYKFINMNIYLCISLQM